MKILLGILLALFVGLMTVNFAMCATVTLEWDAVVDPALVGYNIYQRTGAPVTVAPFHGTYTANGINVGNVLTWKGIGIPAGSYCWVATSYGVGIESEYSNEVCAALPLASPANLRIK